MTLSIEEYTINRMMALLTCRCLNVKIHVNSTDLMAADLTKCDIEMREEFLKLNVGTAHLNLEGVLTEHESLVKQTRSGSWTLHKCINCDTWTHATQGTSHILVNMDMQRDETSLKLLESSTDFSPLYKVILVEKNDNQPMQTQVSVESATYESLQHKLTSIQQQLNNFLMTEQTAMEERIKQFEESEREKFSLIQKKARQDKNNLIRKILSAEAGGAESVDSQQYNQNMENNAQPEKTSYSAEFPSHTQEVHSNPNDIQGHKSRTSKSGSKSTSALSSRLGNNNNLAEEKNDLDGVLFDEDAIFGETNQPFYNSDDDEDENASTTDDSELESPSLYSTSIPISVPAWNMQQRSSHHDDDDGDNEQSPSGPNDIAASIKALARSVHTDDSSIFGDLPRRPRPKVFIYGTSVV